MSAFPFVLWDVSEDCVSKASKTSSVFLILSFLFLNSLDNVSCLWFGFHFVLYALGARNAL